MDPSAAFSVMGRRPGGHVAAALPGSTPWDRAAASAGGLVFGREAFILSVMRLRRAVLGWFVVGIFALAATLPLVSPGRADQNDPRLPALFDILKNTGSPVEAQAAENQIWTIWMTSNDETVSLLMIRGVDAMSAQNLKGAFEIFSEVVQIAPDFAEGWNKRATVLYLMGAYPESIADIDRTLALEPRHFGALSGLGLCNAELKNEKAALDAFERALAVNPHMDGARANAELMRQRIEGKAI